MRTFADFAGDRKYPLFVPVIVEDKIRMPLRNYLISKEVYCLIHWPLSNQQKEKLSK